MLLWLWRVKDSTKNMAQIAQRGPRTNEDELGEQDVIATCVFKKEVPFDHFLFLRATPAAKEDVPEEGFMVETVLIFEPSK